jgi:hypothetical protein
MVGVRLAVGVYAGVGVSVAVAEGVAVAVSVGSGGAVAAGGGLTVRVAEAGGLGVSVERGADGERAATPIKRPSVPPATKAPRATGRANPLRMG